MKKIVVLKRKVKNPRLEFQNFKIKLIVPKKCADQKSIKEILKQKAKWIEEKNQLINKIKEESKKIQLKERKDYQQAVFNLVSYYGKILRKAPKKIIFKSFKNNWGKCFSDGVVIFNKKISFLPLSLIRLIVIHEMCHLVVPKHNDEFKNLLSKFFPFKTYKQKIEKLRHYEYLIFN